MNYLLLCALWIFWCFMHSLFTSTGTTAFFKKRLGDKFRYYRGSYNILSLVTVLPLVYWQGNIPGAILISPPPYLLFIKYALLGTGAVIMAGAFLSFDAKEFLGIRQIIGTPRKTESKPVIAKRGLYGVVRHPIYFGGFIYFTASMINVPLAQFLGYLILALYMVIGTIREDRRLANEIGDEYRNYQKEVPMFLPGLFGK